MGERGPRGFEGPDGRMGREGKMGPRGKKGDVVYVSGKKNNNILSKIYDQLLQTSNTI